jgi:hypothetical protein
MLFGGLDSLCSAVEKKRGEILGRKGRATEEPEHTILFSYYF